MAQQFQADAQATAAAVALVTTAETVVNTSNPVAMPNVNAKFVVRGFVTVTPGTNTTGLTVRIRRGTLTTDTLVGPQVNVTAGVAAAAPITIPFGFAEFLSDRVESQYCVTVEQAGATANGSVEASMIEVECISG